MAASVAGAPCSVGVGGDPTAGVGADELLATLTGAGYDGVDLGPPGYLDAAPGLRARLGTHGLGVAGGWVQLQTGDTDAVLRAVLDACVIARDAKPDLPAPRPTLAAPGPAGARLGAPLRLDDAGWVALVEAVADATRRCRDRGLTPVFHPHVATTVETPGDTERLLESSDVPLCFDTGHVALGGGDPLALLDRWRDRVEHLHLKDVDLAASARLREERAAPERTWDSGVFCALGDGDLALADLLGRLGRWDGWIVVEQDAAVRDADRAAVALADQRRNRAALRDLGW